MQRTSVLFPAPERPMMPKISPGRISSETFLSASKVFLGRRVGLRDVL
jgi:hypothetical protein